MLLIVSGVLCLFVTVIVIVLLVPTCCVVLNARVAGETPTGASTETVSNADALIPSAATVMLEVPAAIPIINPVALIVATVGLLLANVRGTFAMGLPYWSVVLA